MLKKFLNMFRNEKGFSMIELIIVIAIIGIIGAVVAPNFTSTTQKASLKADIASAKTIEKQLALWMAENQKSTIDAADAGVITVTASPDAVDKIGGKLVTAGLLSIKDFTPQIDKAKFTISTAGKVQIDLTQTDVDATIKSGAVAWAGKDAAYVKIS